MSEVAPGPASAPRSQVDPVTLVSTATVDRLPLADGGFLDIPGGPLTYVSAAWERLARPFIAITGEKANVEVIPGDDGQEYLIHRLPPISMPARLSGPAAVLSPIIGEVDPAAVPPADGMLVVDIQGFVREPGVPTGSWSSAFELTPLLRRSHVVKASVSELGRLTQSSRSSLDKLLLLETHGASGVVLQDGTRRDHIPALPLSVTHSIGAGDTLLAAFVDAMLAGSSPLAAARQAVEFTYFVLRERSED